jgi:hypothetical protein
VGKNAEENQKLQQPTYVYTRISTDLLFLHVVGLIQPDLNQINVNVKEKQMPYFDTKTRYAIVGATNDWWSVVCRGYLSRNIQNTSFGYRMEDTWMENIKRRNFLHL